MLDMTLLIPLDEYDIDRQSTGFRRDGEIYREMVTVIQMKDGKPTGLTWPEPFDPEKGDEKELEARFRKRILDGYPPPVLVSVPEPEVPPVAPAVLLQSYMALIIQDAKREMGRQAAIEVKAAIDTIVGRVGRIAYEVARDAAVMAAEEAVRERSWGTRVKKVFRRKR